ncbi:MAG: 3-hydroxy-3-methylglutaryl-CoA synthase [Thaumarchaeota archaeon]|nr:3-hydroxy-3-methylglutaryl-CoA synthase [Nitrososphaerota archaeon]MDE0525468.1 3-hydroxy-3-methylglutaryl-CoA synthase [Nitrososphaerota archaeon]
MAAGIDDIAIYIPRLYLDASDFASARGLDPVKLEKGLGVSQMAMVDADQDPACLAANACLKIMQRNNLSPSDIGRLYVSTESSFDESKAMNSYVVGMLEQVYGPGTFEHCGGVETKFACVSGSYALYDNTNWIRAGESEDQYAMVVVSDIAKYDLESGGEMTQGAGAVVMLLSDEPRLLSFDPRVTSTSIKDEYDFYRPFGKETPIVHGEYSNMLYMMQVKKALETYKKKVRTAGLIDVGPEGTILDHMDYINMHLPYSKMGKKALAYLVRHEWRHLPRWREVLRDIGMEEPVPKDPRGTIESVLADRDFMQRDKEFTRRFTDTAQYQEVYESKLASSLVASRMIGNLYTASLYLGFRSCLEFEHKKGVDLEGRRIGFGSYGSGSSAMVFSGVVQRGYEEIVKKMDLESEIGSRRRLTWDEYVQLHENQLRPEESLADGRGEFVLVGINTDKESSGERHYRYNG